MQIANGTPAASATQNSTTDRLRPVQVPSWFRAGFRMAGAVAPGAAARLGRRLFFTPTRAPLHADQRAVLGRGERFDFAAGGERVVGRAWGEGPTVLLIHGWGGHSGQMAALVEAVTMAGARAVAIDLPGHGESTGRMSSLVHFAAAIERAAALWKPVRGLLAHSFGAAAGTYAMSRGLAVGRAAFFAPPARFDTFWARFRAGVGVSDEVWRRLLRDSESWLQVSFDGIAPIDLAPRMTVPLLVLHDAGDREMPFAEGAELAARWPGAALRRTEGLGHLRILRDPGSIAGAVGFVTA
jgi:pimeloyl-ACP methyl ester carboxylesterase